MDYENELLNMREIDIPEFSSEYDDLSDLMQNHLCSDFTDIKFKGDCYE